MSSTADVIARLNSDLKARKISLARVARETGLHPNTVRNALRLNRGRIDTLQQIEALVDFHRASNGLAEAERPHAASDDGPKATRNYEEAVGSAS